jgi:hypothetical protein
MNMKDSRRVFYAGCKVNLFILKLLPVTILVNTRTMFYLNETAIY